jgi:hypothetical protein
MGGCTPISARASSRSQGGISSGGNGRLLRPSSRQSSSSAIASVFLETPQISTRSRSAHSRFASVRFASARRGRPPCFFVTPWGAREAGALDATVSANDRNEPGPSRAATRAPSTEPNETAAAGLRARRLAAGLSQQRLAELASCSISIVRFYEAGHRATPKTLGKLANALACEPADLRNDERPPNQAGAVQESRRQAGHAEA